MLNPANTRCWTNVGLMLAHRLRHWPNINPTLVRLLVFSGNIKITNPQPLKMKWNESGFRPPSCTYRLNWARRTSWGWWDDWDDTVLQKQDLKFEPWRSEVEHATSRSRRLPTILTFTRGWGRNIFVSFKPPRPGTEPRTLAWKVAVRTITLGPPPPAFKHNSFPAGPHALSEWVNIALRRYLQNHGNIATVGSTKTGLCPTLISKDFKGSL